MQISLSLTTLTLNGGNFVFREQYARTTHSTALSADVIQNGCSARRLFTKVVGIFYTLKNSTILIHLIENWIILEHKTCMRCKLIEYYKCQKLILIYIAAATKLFAFSVRCWDEDTCNKSSVRVCLPNVICNCDVWFMWSGADRSSPVFSLQMTSKKYTQTSSIYTPYIPKS